MLGENESESFDSRSHLAIVETEPATPRQLMLHSKMMLGLDEGPC